jgi:hypothetical protein
MPTEDPPHAPLRMGDGKFARTASGIVVATVGLVYIASAARTLVGGDSAEFAAVSVHGGVAHPPGYPLYVLVLRAFGWLPAFSPAHRASLATALVATASVWSLGRAARAWGASYAASALFAAVYAFSPIAFRLATEPEVFALNVLVAMAICIVASPRVRAPRGDEALRVGLLGLLAGLGIANHHSIVLLAPLGLWAAIRAVRLCASAPKAIALGIAGLALGLVPYAYLVLASRPSAPHAVVWGDTTTWNGFVQHVLRREYGTTQLSASSAALQPAAQIVGLLGTLVAGSFGLSLFAIVGGISVLANASRRRDVAGTLVPYAAFTGAFLLAGPAFVANFNLPPTGFDALVVSRFHLLPFALAMVLGAVGFDAASEALLPTWIAPRLALAALVPLALGRAIASWPSIENAHRPSTEYWLGNVLATLPAHAIVVGSSDDVSGGFLYARALGLRDDVEFVGPHLLFADWYSQRLSARLGFPVVHGERAPGADHPSFVGSALLQQLVETGRPVFLTDWFAKGLDTSFPSYPIGPLVRVVGSPADVPDPKKLLALNEALFDRFDIEPTPAPKSTWSAVRAASYARPWALLAEAFERQGDTATATRCRERAASFMTR